jgi:hypothetical protein
VTLAFSAKNLLDIPRRAGHDGILTLPLRFGESVAGIPSIFIANPAAAQP